MGNNKSKPAKLGESIGIYNFESYSAPQISESGNEDWIEYGEDNNYFQYLIDLFHSSPTNNASIQAISDLIYGGGLEAVKGDRNLRGYIDFKKIFRPEDVKNACMDLKMLGWAVFLMVKSKDRKEYVRAKHWQGQTIRPERANDLGEIKNYYYAPDWGNVGGGDEPKKFAAFGFDKGANESILVIKRFSTGSFYFTPVDYQGGTQYADLECEVANFHINNIKNGLAPSMLINFNNGEADKKVKDQIESAVVNKFGGSSNSGKAILSFNDSKDEEATITPIQLSDADKQYQFLSEESTKKILRSHRITSPMLVGVGSQEGWSSNADEIQIASTYFDNTVIRPFQNTMIDGISKVLNANGHSLDLYFKTLQPLEFTDLSGKDISEQEKEKEMGLSMSKEMTENDEQEWQQFLEDKGEVIDLDIWEEIDEVEIDAEEPIFETEDLQDAITNLEGTENKFNLFKRFANKDKKSADDKGIFLIRYRYGPQQTNNESRVFCKNMVTAAKSGVIYRREDIDSMGKAGVNGQFSEKGKSTYSIWLYKGGAYCHHQWNRVTFRRKIVKGKIIPLTEKEKSMGIRTVIATYDKVANSTADKEGVPFKPTGWRVASKKTIDLPNRGKVN